MIDESHFQGMAEAAVFFLDRASEKIYHCNSGAASMLGRAATDLLGLTCWDALGVPCQPELPLCQAVRSRTRTALSPMLLRPPHVGEMVAGGYLFRQQHEGRDAVVLLLFRLASSQDHMFSRTIKSSDLVAVLGLDSPGQEGQRDGADTARRMIDIRFGLQQIVPARDDVGMPVGSAIPIALRETTIEQGKDISRALLSHLTPLVGSGARIRIGLARCLDGQSPLAALIAANNALLRLQRASEIGRAHV